MDGHIDNARVPSSLTSTANVLIYGPPGTRPRLV